MTTPVLVTFVPFPIPDIDAYGALLNRIADLGGTLDAVGPMRIGHGPNEQQDVVAISIAHENILSLVGKLDNPFKIL